jgi:hypothetical protein
MRITIIYLKYIMNNIKERENIKCKQILIIKKYKQYK